MYMSDDLSEGGAQLAAAGADGHTDGGDGAAAAAVVERPERAAVSGIRIPAAAAVGLGLAVAVTIVVGVLPGLVLNPAADAVPVLVAP